MPLDLLLLPLLALATAVVWWRVGGTRPPRRPRWAELSTPRERRRLPLCVLCRRVGHTVQEHVWMPQAELQSQRPGDYWTSPTADGEWQDSSHHPQSPASSTQQRSSPSAGALRRW
jgi:hypothetical protein